MNLSDIQNYVWRQTDTTVADLPGETIAAYVDEGFQRTVAAENRWPSYEAQWEVTVPAGQFRGPLPSDVNPPGIMSAADLDGGGRPIPQVNHEEAESRWGLSPADRIVQASAYSIWAGSFFPWMLCLSSTERKFYLRGYRKPLVTFAADGQVDADPRLHLPLCHYAIALAYAQQEDDVLEGRYMERWAGGVELARKAIMDPSRNRPIVMYGDWRNRRGVPFSSVLSGGRGGGDDGVAGIVQI